METERMLVERDGKTRLCAYIPKLTCREHPIRAKRIASLYEKGLVRSLERLAKTLGGGELICDFSSEASGEFFTYIFTLRYGNKSAEFADSYKNLEPFGLSKKEKKTLRMRVMNIASRRMRLGEPMFADAEKIAAKKLSAAIMIPYEDGIKLVYRAGLLSVKRTEIFVPMKLTGERAGNSKAQE